MPDIRYTTRQGDVLDAIVYDHYRTTEGSVVETVLRANPGLAARGPVLPQGVVILLPETDVAVERRAVRLWG